MKYVLNHEGKSYRKFFEDICAIPHNSYNEKEIAHYIARFAEERNLWYHMDSVWNVIVKKEASPGYEHHPPVMLQGHTDMVCVKSEGSDFNFETDSLKLYVEDGWLKAKDTTLGADCGHGVAYMLAVLDDDTLKHPPLECFFSVQEESGIGGPKNVDYSLFTAKKLINFDVMVEGSTTLSTTSVKGGDFVKNVQVIPCSGETFKLTVGGCTGGHAGLDMCKERANAIKLCARVLHSFTKESQINLISMSGGTIRNNIPDICEAVFACDAASYELLKRITDEMRAAFQAEHRGTDSNLYLSLEQSAKSDNALDDETTKQVIELIILLPSGIYSRRFMSNGLALILKKGAGDDGLVITSRNLGTIYLDANSLTIGYMFRSAFDSLMTDIFDQVMLIINKYDVTFNQIYDYVGFTNSEDDPLNSLWKDVYMKATGKELIINAIHGGTDVGTIVAGMGGMDVTTLGPDTIDIHCPGEALNIDSFDRTYEYVKTILSKL